MLLFDGERRTVSAGNVKYLKEPGPIPFGRKVSRIIYKSDNFVTTKNQKTANEENSKKPSNSTTNQTKRATSQQSNDQRRWRLNCNLHPQTQKDLCCFCDMDGQPRLVKAKYPFKATNNDELCFSKGDIITITQQLDGGWWEGTFKGKTGWFPSNYVTEHKSGDDKVSQSSNSSFSSDVKEQHHLLVTKHLAENEGEYTNELQGFMQTYLRPLSSANILSNKEYTVLCGNIGEIAAFHQKFFNALNECNKLSAALQKVGGLFLSNAPSIQTLYCSYASNHPSTVSILSSYKDELNTFMEGQGSQPPGSKMLTGQLSLPFRQLDKYPSLLKELERHIDDGHPDRGDTQRALVIYKEINNMVIEMRKDKEMELEVLNADIANWEGEELGSLGDVQLSAYVQVLSGDGGTTLDRIMLMFQSCILMISVSADMHYTYQGKLMIAGLKVKKLEDSEMLSYALQLSGPMIDEMVVAFNSSSKQSSWYESITNLSKQNSNENTQQLPKSVKSATMPAQVTSKAKVQTVSNSVKTAQVIDSYDKIRAHHEINKMWMSYSCLRPLPPSRPQLSARDDFKSPKVQRKASTLGRRKNVDDAKVLQEDAKILQVIEAYCASVKTRHTVNSSILDSPNMLIAEDEKIICEITKDNQTFIEEKSLVDTVYVIKDQIKDLHEEQQKLRKELEDERKARRKLESLIQTTLIPTRIKLPSTSSINNHNSSDNAND